MRKILFLFAISFTWNCSNGFFHDLFNRNKTSFPLPAILSGAPKVTLPESIPSQSLRMEEDQNVPRLLGRSQVPIGNVYNLTLDLNDKNGKGKIPYKSLFFQKPVQLEFPVDLGELKSKGFTQEFYVWYKDFSSKEWRVLQKGKLDIENSSVKVETNHFTPFILTALPNLPGTGVAPAASCFTNESASWNLQGVLDDSSASQAKFGIIGEGYQYYQDRPYFVKENEGAFRELGLELSLLFPTCQGGTGICGNSLLHSASTSPEYIAFNAVQDIDVYVMYDTRGGSSPSDTSQDADWLQADFTLLSGKFIYTTEPGLDPAQTPGASGYKVYKKTYTQGSRVSLGGNIKGTSASGISSNYWVVVKPAGTQGSVQSSAMLCASGPDPNVPNPVKGYIFPGSDKVLLWLFYPSLNSPKKIIVRRSEISPPMTPAMGEEPTGLEITPYSYIDSGLVEGHTYYYSIFALNEDGLYNGITIGTANTGMDTDGDGLSDYTEAIMDIGSYFGFNANDTNAMRYYMLTHADSNGNGINDLMELANGQAPYSVEKNPPIVQASPYTQNASSGIVDLKIDVSDDSYYELDMFLCYVRRYDPSMTEEEFLRKPFGSSTFGDQTLALSESLDYWSQAYKYNSRISSHRLGKSGPNLPDRFAIWGKDRYGNISEPTIIEFQMRESKGEHSFVINQFDPAQVPNANRRIAFASLLPDPFWDYPSGVNVAGFYVNPNIDISGISHIIPVKDPENLTQSSFRFPSFIAFSQNKAAYYEPSGNNILKKNEVPINYEYSASRPLASHFQIQLGADSAVGALYSNASNVQASIFKIENGLLSANSYLMPEIPGGSYPLPSSVLSYDRGAGLGVIIGSKFLDYTLDSFSSPIYQPFGTGTTDTNLSGVISSDRLNSYNPQNEPEVFVTMRNISSQADIKLLYRKSGYLNFSSVNLTGLPSNFNGVQVKFISFYDFVGNPVYQLFVYGIRIVSSNPYATESLLLRYKVSSVSGIPTAVLENQTVLNNYREIYIDNSGRYIIGNLGNWKYHTYLNKEEGPVLLSTTDFASPGGKTQFSFVPTATNQVGNIGGYSKIRILPSSGYSDYQRYGFVPADSDIIVRHHAYDWKANECGSSPTPAGTEDIIATATGNYGVPPLAIAVQPAAVPVQNTKRIKAPSSAANLVLESSFTQATSPCRTSLIARDTATLPVRKKFVVSTTSYYHDFSLNPANVPATYNTAPSPSGYDAAEFKKWEPLSKSSPQRLGTYVRKNILFWWPYAIIDEWNPCIITDVTMEDGRAICHNNFGGYPAFVEDYVNQYDRYTFTSQFVYSGDKLIPAP
ncbi:hypothetical protein [Leptospira saintgironsiae]|uniref:hypothetical protein n=1 Tax=Leptospira saintgironsiae TaxID=2023183 RepID=UPI000F62C67F|nr:hypothetical protein [Leptospira saintgironsiae]